MVVVLAPPEEEPRAVVVLAPPEARVMSVAVPPEEESLPPAVEERWVPPLVLECEALPPTP